MEGMRGRRLLLSLTVVLSVLVGTTQEVGAHSVYVYDGTYASDTNCTWVRSEISHGTQNSGYSRVDVESWYRWESPGGFGSYDCYTQWDRSAWKIRAKYTVMKKIAGTEDWAWCLNTDWYYNQSTTWQYVIHGWHGENYSPPCGHGDYATSGGGYVENGGTWYGGYVFAAQHWLP